MKEAYLVYFYHLPNVSFIRLCLADYFSALRRLQVIFSYSQLHLKHHFSTPNSYTKKCEQRIIINTKDICYIFFF